MARAPVISPSARLVEGGPLMRSITIPFEVLWTDVDPLGYV
ncbi:hypothetical protein trd_0585 [Thermomicrobium roseum DSM 5159]|uniref:Uncharacterized protein n=1 Tax=Thermomicrobium roseum (strain ATCC 27502 / DSM 5159 / P-2) TaxID=309801 RepID=B9KYN8_THERP|nr:hypothetical protein trd_0585 [Thermomicrobium roseum DSM 5159]